MPASAGALLPPHGVGERHDGQHLAGSTRAHLASLLRERSGSVRAAVRAVLFAVAVFPVVYSFYISLYSLK